MVSGTRRGIGTLVAVTLTVLLVLVLEGSPAAAASPTTCWVRNTDIGQTYTRFQQAVKAAKPGASLVVAGTCHGTTVIRISLVIVGERAKRAGRPTLDGDAKVKHVLRIRPGIKVAIRGLTIQGGRVRNLYGAGIINRGTLKLRDVVVRRNKAGSFGGGIYNEGTLLLEGTSRIRRNRGYASGGLMNAGTTRMSDTASIRDNRGGGVVNRGTLVLNDAASIRDNDGIGVHNGHAGYGWEPPAAFGSLTLNDRSSISGNSGMGVWNANGSLTLTGTSSIHDHDGQSPVGGVYNAPGGSVTMHGLSSIHHNRGYTGAIYNLGGAITMTGSSTIHDNHASASMTGAGGIWSSSGGTLVGVNCAPHTYANVYGNTPDDCYFEP